MEIEKTQSWMTEFLTLLEMGTWLDLVAAVLGLFYLILIIKEKMLAWPFGIVSSAMYVFIMYDLEFIMETVTYVFYVAMGFYGWWHWVYGKTKKSSAEVVILRWPVQHHFFAVIVGLVVSLIIGYSVSQFRPKSSFPYLDAFTTTFAFLATYMEAKKVLNGWIYWIVINLLSVYLYAAKGLVFSPALMALYATLSIVGFLRWRKSYELQIATN